MSLTVDYCRHAWLPIAHSLTHPHRPGRCRSGSAGLSRRVKGQCVTGARRGKAFWRPPLRSRPVRVGFAACLCPKPGPGPPEKDQCPGAAPTCVAGDPRRHAGCAPALGVVGEPQFVTRSAGRRGESVAAGLALSPDPGPYVGHGNVPDKGSFGPFVAKPDASVSEILGSADGEGTAPLLVVQLDLGGDLQRGGLAPATCRRRGSRCRSVMAASVGTVPVRRPGDAGSRGSWRAPVWGGARRQARSTNALMASQPRYGRGAPAPAAA